MEDDAYITLANGIIKKFKNLDSLKPNLTFQEEGDYIIKILRGVYKKGYDTGWEDCLSDNGIEGV